MLIRPRISWLAPNQEVYDCRAVSFFSLYAADLVLTTLFGENRVQQLGSKLSTLHIQVSTFEHNLF